MSSLISASLVDLNMSATDSGAATRRLAELMHEEGRVTKLDTFLADVTARETQMPTGLEGGIGIPHARSEAVTEPTVAFGRSSDGVNYGASDGPAHLIFLIAAPSGGGDEHLKVLAALARRLVHASFKEALMQANDAQDVVDLFEREVVVS